MIFTKINIGNHLTDLTLINKAQPLTMYKKNKAERGLFINNPPL